MRSPAGYCRPLLAILFFLLPSVVAPTSIALATPQNNSSNNAVNNDTSYVTHDELVKRYEAAVRDAQQMRAAKIDTELTLIAKSNPHLQWKTFDGQECVKVALFSDTFYDAKVGKPLAVDPGRTTWVMVPSDLKEWYAAHHPKGLLLLRLKQLLGIPPDATKTRIVEMWVRPQDMKRPSIEPAIDKEIDLATLFARDNWFTPDGDETYNNWFYRQCAESYVMPDEHQDLYPWTRLGYTYDWGNPQYPHIGLSEFIIWGGVGVKAWVESSKKPEEYLH